MARPGDRIGASLNIIGAAEFSAQAENEGLGAQDFAAAAEETI